LNLATVSAVNALSAVTNLLSGGKLILYTGTQPTTPETALSGNTPLATFTFANPAFGSASLSGGNEQQTASFAASSVTPGTGGVVTFARSTVLSAAWATSTGYTYGQMVTANSNLYFCTKAGTSAVSGSGPATTAASITDATVQWQYLGGSTQVTVADFSVGTSGTDIIIGNTTLSTSINVTITSFVLQIPAS
jgi:hypothetical protein